MPSILLVEDDEIDRRAVERVFRIHGRHWVLHSASTIADANFCLDSQDINVIVADFRLNDGTAMEMLKRHSVAPIIVTTGSGDEQTAVSALKAGAYDYLIKDASGVYLDMLFRTVENAYSFHLAEQEAERQRIFSEALRSLSAVLNSSLDLSDILQHISEAIERVIPHHASCIMLMENKVIRIPICRGTSAERLAEITSTVLDITKINHLQQMIAGGKARIIPNLEKSSDWQKHPLFTSAGSCLGAPIISDGETLGFLNLHNTQYGFFNNDHAEWLQAFAEQTAIAIENARLYRQSIDMALIAERQRLARDLHDSVTQTLFAASVISDAMFVQWQRDPASIGRELADMQVLTRDALSEMREMLVNLGPDNTSDADLSTLIEQLVTKVQHQTGMVVLYQSTGTYIPPPTIKMALFRIVQESLTNIIKHSGADAARITLRRLPKQIEIVIRDDGSGFDPTQQIPGHLGLKFMRERAQSADITLSIESQHQQGTRIRAVWKEA